MKTMKQAIKATQKGFTLIEVLIVLSIIAMMFGMVIASLDGVDYGASKDVVKGDMKSISTSLDRYKLNVKTYPSSNDGLEELVSSENERWAGPYLNEIPMDPWGTAYGYELVDGKPVIISYGTDGKSGGSGEEEDLRSDELK
jgi:general secretion pathway protein G